MADTQPPAPTDAELDELRQANSGRLNFVTFSEFRVIARAVLEKWGTPAHGGKREPLTDGQIAEMMRETWGCASIAPRHAMGFARAIESEVREQYTALIRQLVASLEGYRRNHNDTQPCDAERAGRAWLEGKA